MDRIRALSSSWSLCVALVCSVAQAQQSQTLHRIAFLAPGNEVAGKPSVDIFVKTLHDLGYREGRNIAIDLRWGGDDPSKMKSIAVELARRNPEVMVTATSGGIIACKEATSSIPIVFASAGNVVEQQFVSSLQRPGGNITGVMINDGITSKLVEIIRDTLPKARRLALLIYDKDPIAKTAVSPFMADARRYKFEPLVVSISGAEDFGRGFDELAKQKTDAVVLPPLQIFSNRRAQLEQLVLKRRLPIFTAQTLLTNQYFLVTYGTDGRENYRRAAAFVDRILRGATPAELPVERPDRFQLIVNLKMARAIGVTIPPVMILRADSVIE